MQMPGIDVLAYASWAAFCAVGIGICLRLLARRSRAPRSPRGEDPPRQPGSSDEPGDEHPPGYRSGVRVSVDLVRVCFLKNAGRVIRR
jgi:hypothetical protein